MDLSIIIPTLNEAKYIIQTLDWIQAHMSNELDIEIIIIDAGSGDDTVGIVAAREIQVCVDPLLAGAKYKSLNKGASLAKGELLLFLDADTFLPLHFDSLIKAALNEKGIVGGAFEFGFNKIGIVYRVIEWINRMRYRVDKRYFGDQAIFCSRKTFDQINGYPNEPIMEAAYFCKSLRKIGKLKLVKTPVLTSARRFEQGNVFKVFFKDTWIWIQFTLGMNIRRYALAYWQENKNGG